MLAVLLRDRVGWLLLSVLLKLTRNLIRVSEALVEIWNIHLSLIIRLSSHLTFENILISKLHLSIHEFLAQWVLYLFQEIRI